MRNLDPNIFNLGTNLIFTLISQILLWYNNKYSWLWSRRINYSVWTAQTTDCKFALVSSAANRSPSSALKARFSFSLLTFLLPLNQNGREFLIQANTQKRRKLEDDNSSTSFEHVEVYLIFICYVLYITSYSSWQFL